MRKRKEDAKLAFLRHATSKIKNEYDLAFPAESEEIRRYLAGDVLAADGRGWTLVKVDGLSLGWAKGDGQTLKNHYPKALRRCV